MKAAREFTFDAAHRILDGKGSPCEALHGHTYKLRVVVEGDVGKDGKVVDFREIKEVVGELVLSELDHADLNGVMDNPTAENIALWIFDRLKKKLNVASVRVWEGSGKWAEAP